MIKKLALLSLISSLSALEPWLTGPLIAPSGLVTAGGSTSLDFNLYVVTNTGTYDAHGGAHSTPNFYMVNPQIYATVGLTPWMDIALTPQAFYNTTQGAHSTHLGDTLVTLDFQLLTSPRGALYPNIKFSLGATLPTGKYQRGNPKKLLTDLPGMGSFQPTAILVLYKQFHWDKHILSTTLSGEYVTPLPVHIHGLSSYGGDTHTRGKVYPGCTTTLVLSFEFMFTQNWVFAIDNVFLHENKDRFSGHHLTPQPSLEQFSFSPAIEYNWSANLGMIVGAYVTGFGRNALQFRSCVIGVDLNL